MVRRGDVGKRADGTVASASDAKLGRGEVIDLASKKASAA
jgi:hypothetical protein